MNKKAFFILVSTMFISMLGLGLVVPFLPIYASKWGASGFEIGLIFASFSIVQIFFLPVMGRLSDRIGRKLLLILGLFSLTIVATGFIFAQNTLHLIILRVLQGLAGTMHLPVAQAYIGDLTPEGEEGKWMGYFNAVMFAGIGAGPVFGGVLNDLFGMTTAFATNAILTFICFLVTIIFIKETKKKSSDIKPTLSLMKLAEDRSILGILIIQMTMAACMATITTFLPIFASKNLALSATLIGVILAAQTPVSMLQTFTGRLADKYNRKVLILSGAFLTIVFISILPFAENFFSLLLIVLLAYLGMPLCQPSSAAYIVEEGRAYGMGSAMGILMTAVSIGFGLGPILIGGIVNFLGVNSAYFFSAVINLLGVTVFIMITKVFTGKNREVPLPEES